MKLQVATPIHYSGEPLFWQSIMRAQQDGLFSRFRVNEGDSAVARARNNLVHEFLKTDDDALLFIDADIVFNPGHIACLKSHGPQFPIVAGMYPLKKPEHQWCINGLNEGKTPKEHGPLFQVKYVGTGFMLIWRQVFEKFMQVWPEHFYEDDMQPGQQVYDFFRMGVFMDTIGGGRRRWLSEDWYFCEMWNRLGGEIFIDRRVTVQHVGKAAYPIDKAAHLYQPKDFVDMECPASMQPHIQKVLMGEYDVKLDEQPATVLDLGANVGAFSVWAAKKWPNAKIVAYEPVQSNFELLQKNLEKSGLSDRVTCHRQAVGESTRTRKMFHGRHNCGECSFFDLGEQNTDSPETVEVVDAALVGSAEFVKLDVEGAELEILEELDLTDTKAIALEWHGRDRLEACLQMLGERGFETSGEQTSRSDSQRGILKLKRKVINGSEQHGRRFAQPDAAEQGADTPAAPTSECVQV